MAPKYSSRATRWKASSVTWRSNNPPPTPLKVGQNRVRIPIVARTWFALDDAPPDVPINATYFLARDVLIHGLKINVRSFRERIIQLKVDLIFMSGFRRRSRFEHPGDCRHRSRSSSDYVRFSGTSCPGAEKATETGWRCATHRPSAPANDASFPERASSTRFTPLSCGLGAS
jgi:hypothetical protein